MMKHIKRRVSGTGLLLIVFVIMLAGMTGLALGENGKAPDKPSVIKVEKGDISFSHEKHAKAEGGCTACHSVFPPKNGQIQALKASGKLKGKSVMAMCRECHGKLMAANKDTGPTADCTGCHKK